MPDNDSRKLFFFAGIAENDSTMMPLSADELNPQSFFVVIMCKIEVQEGTEYKRKSAC